MQDKYILIHGAFQSPESWKVPHGFSAHVVRVDCSTFDLFQRDIEVVLKDIEYSPQHLIIVATSLGCIHGINLANLIVKKNMGGTTLVFCAVPSLISYKWQTFLVCSVLKMFGFLRWVSLPTRLARKLWTTSAHQENIRLLSAPSLDHQKLSEQVNTHVIYTIGDPIAGTKTQQAKWVHLRSKSTLKTSITLFSHYPYIFDKYRFWSYLSNLDSKDA